MKIVIEMHDGEIDQVIVDVGDNVTVEYVVLDMTELGKDHSYNDIPAEVTDEDFITATCDPDLGIIKEFNTMCHEERTRIMHEYGGRA